MGGESDQPIAAPAPAAAAAADAAAAAPAPAANVNDVVVRIAGEFEAFPASDSKPANFVASLVAPVYDESKQKTPADLIVCLDVSGSMQGEKLTVAVDSLKFLLSQLRSKDRIGLVVFDTDVSVTFGLTQTDAQGKLGCSAAIDRIRAGSSTNLSGGLLKAMELMQQRSDADAKDRVGSVLLFTDGQANVGIRDAASMATAVRNMLVAGGGNKNNFTVQTFGFGADHSPDMLRAICEAGGGMYYFVKSTEDIPESFADALGGLLSTVAQNVTLRLEVPEGMRLGKIHSVRPAATSADGRRSEIPFSDLQADEIKDVLFEVYLPSASPVAAAAAASAASASAEAASAASAQTTTVAGTITAQISYFNLITNAPGAFTAELVVQQCPEDSAVAQSQTANANVERQKLRMLASLNTTKAKTLATSQLFTEAKACLETAIAELKPIAEKQGGATSGYAGELMSELQACSNAISMRDQQRNYMQTMHSCEQQQQQQRSNVSGFSSYCTPMKASMKARSKPKPF